MNQSRKKVFFIQGHNWPNQADKMKQQGCISYSVPQNSYSVARNSYSVARNSYIEPQNEESIGKR